MSNMVPKVIHYCWFGRNPLPEEYKEYIRSWKKYCPDYKIIEWNEDNFDVTENAYCREAYQAGKWAFVSDYARLKIIYENGGVYFDTDVELLRDITPLVSDGFGFIGFQNPIEATTGLGFAAAPYNICVKAMLDMYESRHFEISKGKYDLLPCPVVNTVALVGCGMRIGRKHACAIQRLNGMNVYPICYFNPMNSDTRKCKITDKTYTIHHYSATWIADSSKKLRRIKALFPSILLDIRTEYIAKRDVLKYIKKRNEGNI